MRVLVTLFGVPGPWLLSIEHSGVAASPHAAEVNTLPISPMAGPGLITFELATLSQLHAALDRVYKLAVSLPEAPLERFQSKIKGAAADDRSGVARYSTYRPGCVSRCPDGLLGQPLLPRVLFSPL